MKLRYWIEAARLRTLPLSLASIIAGGALARQSGRFRIDIFLLALLTTTTLQILSNFANDYGDFVKGTDSDARIGPRRGLQSGAIDLKQMQWAMIVLVGLSSLFGVPLIILGSGSLLEGSGWLFTILGLGAIAAAIAYTVGPRPYGYSGLGDIFVFLFFGPVAVLGTRFLITGAWAGMDWLPASAFGFLSVGVLNINNMRDRENDAASGKHTLPVRLGLHGAKIYHRLLLVFGLGALVLYGLIITRFRMNWWFGGLWGISLRIFISQRQLLFRPSREMDPFLKKLSLGALALAVYFFIWMG
ncbi:MAG: 1,4-dihydroxy-2-naphthoate octaprenyltransferase [FCB group bacterium]|nr:1,4-dihydroxy-2-naphthoate octaprenyltransferase [FCB group bacterium]